MGAIYGLSLGSQIWAATHKQDNSYSQDYTRFDALQNTVSSDSMVSLIYGERKWAGNQLWHNASSDGLYLTKDVLIGEGEIDSISDVRANDIGILRILEDVTLMTVVNTKYPKARCYIRKLPAGIAVNLETSDKAGDSSFHGFLFNQTIQEVCNFINSKDGFIATTSYPTRACIDLPAENPIDIITGIEHGWCYNIPIDFKSTKAIQEGLPGCSYEFHNGASTQTPPSNWSTVGGYKNMAYLRCNLTASAKLNSGNPTITYVVKGKKITDTRTNVKAWSNNPAMIVRDFLLSKRYGVAKFVPNLAYVIDEESFKEVADYCDEMIYFYTTTVVTQVGTIDANIATIQAQIDAGGDSTKLTAEITKLQIQKQALINGQTSADVNLLTFEKRSTLNLIIDQKKSVIDNLADMFAVFGGFLVYSNGKLSLRVEKSESSSYSFTNDTIVENSLSFQQMSTDDTPNQYKIGYFDPTNNWTQVKVLVEDLVDQQPQPIGRGMTVTKEITLAGCTSQAQAIRMGRLYKNLNKLCSVTVTFKTTTFAMHLHPGDVIDISYDKIHDGVSYPFIQNSPWRILEITQQDGQWNIKARQYNESIYGGVTDVIQVKNYVPIANPLSSIVPNVSDVILNENSYILKDGSVLTDVSVNYTEPNYQFISRYEIWYKLDNGTYVYYGSSPDNQLTIKALPNAVGKKITVKVITENTIGRKSDGIESSQLFIVGKSTPPGNVTGFSVGQVGDKLYFSWNLLNELDIKLYEIRDGDSWATSMLVAQESVNGKYETSLFTGGDHKYMIKALDRSGNYSTTATEFQVTITDPPKRNVILGITKVIEKRLAGRKMNEGKLMSLGLYMNSPTVYDDYFYVDEPIDIGEALSNNLVLTVMYDSTISPNIAANVEMSTSLDGITYSGWQQYSPGTYTFRYVNLRIHVVSLDQKSNVFIKALTISIDVPDKDEVRKAETISTPGWTSFTFANPYYLSPTLYTISQTRGVFAYPRNITKNRFEVILEDSTGTPVVGSFLYVVNGY